MEVLWAQQLGLIPDNPINNILSKGGWGVGGREWGKPIFRWGPKIARRAPVCGDSLGTLTIVEETRRARNAGDLTFGKKKKKI